MISEHFIQVGKLQLWHTYSFNAKSCDLAQIHYNFMCLCLPKRNLCIILIMEELLQKFSDKVGVRHLFTCQCCVVFLFCFLLFACLHNTTAATSRAGTTYPSGALPVFNGISCCSILSFFELRTLITCYLQRLLRLVSWGQCCQCILNGHCLLSIRFS